MELCGVNLGKAKRHVCQGHVCCGADCTKECRDSAELRTFRPLGGLKDHLLSDVAYEYSWEEVLLATNGFCSMSRIGKGAYGTVYGGKLSEGTEVAVKVMDAPVGGGFEEEVRVLSLCRHPNVVMLLGFARLEDDPLTQESIHILVRRALIYELLGGGDLRSRLGSSSNIMPWHLRVRALIDVSRGLVHLHKHRPEIFHRDIKSQNVLFSSDGTAKIADFGLACVSRYWSERNVSTDDMAGTPGYADPLYASTGILAEAHEVYSFGMVLIEVLTRHPPVSRAQDGRGYVFLLHRLKPHEENAKQRILDRLDDLAMWPAEMAASLASIALLCIHRDVDLRPTFLEVATLLQELAAMLPSQPVQKQDKQGQAPGALLPPPPVPAYSIFVEGGRDGGAASGKVSHMSREHQPLYTGSASI